MATNSKQKKADEPKTDLLWRKPITLEAEDDEDPLAMLYRGREVIEPTFETHTKSEKLSEKVAEPAEIEAKKAIIIEERNEITERKIRKKQEKAEIEVQTKNEGAQVPTKVTESELKAALKIKSDGFNFTDIREILRGKSLDIYAYLRHISGETGFCKIKHLDLMKKLDISRPTLFKQGEWLTKLSLIEKRNVPGDHFGTSYTIYRLEEVLPVSETIVEQLESHIDNFQNMA